MRKHGSAFALETKGVATRTHAERRAFLVRELKATNDAAGTFEGYVAVFTNMDGNGDVIDRGAFKRTLGIAREQKARDKTNMLYPLLWQHDEDEPIGLITDAYEDDHGLFIKGEYDLDTLQGARAYSGAKKGYLRGLSIGYRTVKSMMVGQVRHLAEIQLFEGSPVTFPANDLAGVTSVKSADGAVENKGVSGKTDWPIADRDTKWDSGGAHGRLLEWAGGKDDLDTSKFSSVHFWSPDGDAKQNVSEYKFPFCDIIDGSPKAVPAAVIAATGSHGIQSAKGVDTDGIKSRIAGYYRKMHEKFGDDFPDSVPWDAKALNAQARAELKNVTGLAALTGCAANLDSCADGSAALVECLAQACGMSIEDGAQTGTPDAAVAALLSGVDGLPEAVKAVIMAWQEFSTQTDALLVALGLPDNDYGYGDYAVPMYMSQLRNAFELKAGRQLSQSNRDRLDAHAKALARQVEEVKSILKDNDNPLKDEMDQDNDYGDYISSGQHNPPKGKSRTPGADPARTTPSQAPGDSEAALLATLQDMDEVAFARNLEKLTVPLGVGR